MTKYGYKKVLYISGLPDFSFISVNKMPDYVT